MERPEGYPEVLEDMTETDSGASFQGPKNDMSQLESGLLRRNHSDVGGNGDYYRFRSNNIGKWAVDQKLLALVEFFRELYVRRIELFKKIFPGSPPDRNFLADMPKKLNMVLSQVKSDQTSRARTMQRSLSIGSPREFRGDETSEMRLERFKIRTIDVDDDVDQDKTKPGGSK